MVPDAGGQSGEPSDASGTPVESDRPSDSSGLAGRAQPGQAPSPADAARVDANANDAHRATDGRFAYAKWGVTAAVESLRDLLPGFRGYANREDRQQADLAQRQWLAERLERGKRGVEAYARTLADAGQLSALMPLERVRGQCDQLCNRIRGAGFAGGGLFGHDDVAAARLEKIDRHDTSLIDLAADTADTMESLGESPTDAAPRLVKIAKQLADLADAWDTREDLLRE